MAVRPEFQIRRASETIHAMRRDHSGKSPVGSAKAWTPMTFGGGRVNTIPVLVA